MFLVGVIWIVVAFGLWLYYASTHAHERYEISGPFQQTFGGALMWPFYLISYTWHKIKNHLN
jgi:hypothetical protein